ncbi:hypothetical protein CEQ07_01335 [Oligella urethralis]|nr:hypothetical protein CEQ07_01335 [Oligella urethralis]
MKETTHGTEVRMQGNKPYFRRFEGLLQRSQLIKAGHPIIMRSREDYYDVRYWECNGYVIPCGGTHVKNTKELSSLKLQRKNLGKGKERLIFSLRTNL